jgi:hypothetical protein
MPKFKLADPVRITAPTSRHFDAVGTVTDVDRSQPLSFRVSGVEGVPVWFGAHELVLAEVVAT